MFKKFDRVQETTTTTGTGSITLAGAVSGFRTFGSVLVAGDMFLYSLLDGAAWETGIGTYQGGNVFTRGLDASSTGSLINLSGSANVFMSPTVRAFKTDFGKGIAMACRIQT